MLLEEKMRQNTRNEEDSIFLGRTKKGKGKDSITHLLQMTRRKSSASTTTNKGTSKKSVERSLQMRRTV